MKSKVAFFSLFILLGAYSCNNSKEAQEIIPDLSLGKQLLIDKVKVSDIARQFESNFIGTFGYLNYSEAQFYEYSTDNFIAFVPTITRSKHNSKMPAAYFVVYENVPSKSIVGYVMDLRSALTNNLNQFEMGSISLLLPENLEFGLIQKKSTGKAILLDGKDIEKIYEIQSNRNLRQSWWGCTTNCYRTAKSACGADAECDFLCDLVDLGGGCTISLAAACGTVCAIDQDAPIGQ